MELNFKIGGRKKVDIAIFHHGQEHSIENLSRAVICRQEPNVGKNNMRIRDFEQAAKDLDEIEVEFKKHTERLRIGGRYVQRTLTRSEKIEDNDLPVIAEKYQQFLKDHSL